MKRTDEVLARRSAASVGKRRLPCAVSPYTLSVFLRPYQEKPSLFHWSVSPFQMPGVLKLSLWSRVRKGHVVFVKITAFCTRPATFPHFHAMFVILVLRLWSWPLLLFFFFFSHFFFVLFWKGDWFRWLTFVARWRIAQKCPQQEGTIC